MNGSGSHGKRNNARNAAPNARRAMDIQHALNIGAQHHNAGRAEEAKRVYKEILSVNPKHPDALFLLGLLAHQTGDNKHAVKILSKTLSVKADHVVAHNILGNAYRALGDLDKAERSYRNAIALQPDLAEAHFNLGNVQAKKGERISAVASFGKALEFNSRIHQAHNSMGTALYELGRLDEAAECFRKAVSIEPRIVTAHVNLAAIHESKGNLEEAVRILRTALEHNPGNTLILDALFDNLNFHTPTEGAAGEIVDAQLALSRVNPENGGSGQIADETVRDLYQRANAILMEHGLDVDVSLSQIYRGQIDFKGCDRYHAMFKEFNIIPKYCFSCYKIGIDVDNVVELLKLMIIFDEIDLPNDNSRKCFVEIRPEISGTYKGIIFTMDLDEAYSIHETLQDILDTRIRKGIKPLVRRGCSEFPLAFPEFGKVENRACPMEYVEKWRAIEEKADGALAQHSFPDYKTHNHEGLTARDALVMRNWLSYAATIGDPSFRKISGEPAKKLRFPERRPFQPS